MFRVKQTRRNAKRAISPFRPATDISGGVAPIVPPVVPPVSRMVSDPSSFGKNLCDFFEAETAACLLTKPWLRLERGLRLQKFRSYSDSYPGLSTDEKESLCKMLIKVNDAKFLNTKQQINYEGGKILSVRGLKVIRSGDPTEPVVFKIEASRGTKKHSED